GLRHEFLKAVANRGSKLQRRQSLSLNVVEQRQRDLSIGTDWNRSTEVGFLPDVDCQNIFSADLVGGIVVGLLGLQGYSVRLLVRCLRSLIGSGSLAVDAAARGKAA